MVDEDVFVVRQLVILGFVREKGKQVFFLLVLGISIQYRLLGSFKYDLYV